MRLLIRFSGFPLVALVFFLLPTVTLAKVITESDSEFSNGQWVWALFSLIFILFLTYWGTRFLAGKVVRSSAVHLKVAESLLLGPNRHLYLLLVNGKVLLLGSSEHGITLLQEIDDPQFHTELLQSATKLQLPTGKLSEYLSPILKQIKEKISK